MFLSQTTTKNACPVAEHNTHELTHVLLQEMVGVTNETDISWSDKQFIVIFLSSIFFCPYKRLILKRMRLHCLVHYFSTVINEM